MSSSYEETDESGGVALDVITPPMLEARPHERHQTNHSDGFVLVAEPQIHPLVWFTVSSLFSRLKDVFLAFIPLGFITFGGPQAHIAVLQQQFVEKRKWLTDTHFTELFGLGSALPGPTSSQMVAAIGMLHASFLGGILSLICFQLPGAIVMTAFGLAISSESVGQWLQSPPAWFLGFKNGLFAGAISLIGIAVWKLGQKSTNTKFTQAILIASTVQTILIKSAWTLPLSLVIFGVLSWAWLTKFHPEEIPAPPPLDESRDEAETDAAGVKSLWNHETKIGALMIGASVIALLGLMLLRAVAKDCPTCAMAETFYRVGALIYGGGQVVLPMMITELVDTGIMSEATFLYGLTIIQVLPGPLFNFAAFLGAVISGLWGALIAWVLIFAPGVLLIFGVYPFWHRLAKMDWMRKVLVGVNAAALGFILSAFFLLFAKVPTIYDACAVLVCLLVAFYDLNTPAAIGIGGVAGIIIGLLFQPAASPAAPVALIGAPVALNGTVFSPALV